MKKLFTHPPEVYWRLWRKRRHQSLYIPSEKETHCLNCGTFYKGNYCPVCGQSRKVNKLTWGRLCTHILYSLMKWRAGLGLTLLELCGHPGHFIYNYLKGQRIPYVNPWILLSLFLLLYLYLSALVPQVSSFHFQALGLTSWLANFPSSEWGKTVAGYALKGLSYLHTTDMTARAMRVFKDVVFLNQAAQSLVFLPIFTICTYFCLNHRTYKSPEERKKKAPNMWMMTFYMQFKPFLIYLRYGRRILNRKFHTQRLRFAAWWDRVVGDRPTFILHLIHRFFHGIKWCIVSSVRFVRMLCKGTPNREQPLRYTILEIIWIRAYLACLLLFVNCVLICIGGIFVTPFNPWVIAATVIIHKQLFRGRWWDVIKRTIFIYVLLLFTVGCYSMFAALHQVVNNA